MLAALAETIALVRVFLAERRASLDAIIESAGFDRNAAIVAAKEAANENDETRKRFEVMCREVFRKFKACINVQGVNAHRREYDAINIVYASLQKDREQADITEIIRELHAVVDEAIDTKTGGVKYSGPTISAALISIACERNSNGVQLSAPPFRISGRPSRCGFSA